MPYERPGTQPTHSLLIGYVFLIFGGVLGLHRFYYGRILSGLLWMLTGGLLLIGVIVDLFLVPAMDQAVEAKYHAGPYDYNVAWLLLAIPPLGVLGFHRFYQGKIITGILWLLTAGLAGIGVLYDWFTLNDQINLLNWETG